MRKYVVVYERAEDRGWGAYLPDLAGVVALGASRDEVADRIQEALDAYVEAMSSLGQPLPEPVAVSGTVQAAKAICREGREPAAPRARPRGRRAR